MRPAANAYARFIYGDARGSIVYRADTANTSAAINTYDEYGVPGAANTGRFQYTGQAWLPELGMYYYKARIYSPSLGRFLQTDPIGYEDNNNLYGYVANDPVNGLDPTGMIEVEEEKGEEFTRAVPQDNQIADAESGMAVAADAGEALADADRDAAGDSNGSRALRVGAKAVKIVAIATGVARRMDEGNSLVAALAGAAAEGATATSIVAAGGVLGSAGGPGGTAAGAVAGYALDQTTGTSQSAGDTVANGVDGAIGLGRSALTSASQNLRARRDALAAGLGNWLRPSSR